MTGEGGMTEDERVPEEEGVTEEEWVTGDGRSDILSCSTSCDFQGEKC